MTESERQEMLNEARRFYLAAPILIPILDKRILMTTNKLIAKHRDGDNNFITLVSELVVLTDIKNEINSKESTYRLLEGKNQ